MRKIKLNNGLEMPVLGYGVYQITDPYLCEQCVVDAVHSGYTLIDTAAYYANEQAVGKAIKRCGLSREDLFVTTKLWIQRDGFEGARKSFEASLKRLKVDYIDLYLIHQPYGDVYGEWRAMEELYRQGKVRAIGVSNFHPDRIMDLMIHHDIIPAINQIEVNPFIQQTEAQMFLQKYNVQVEAWAPFAEGRNNLFKNELLQSIAMKYRKSIAQVIGRWLIQREIVVISKTVHKERMEENIQIFDFELNAEDMTAIKSLDTGTSSFFDHRDPEKVLSIGTRKFEN